jgi:hypothetical protein
LPSTATVVSPDVAERMAGSCAECGGPLPPPAGRGRPRVTCSAACRARAWRHRRDTDRQAAELNAAFGAAVVPLDVPPDSDDLLDRINAHFKEDGS